MAEQTRCSRRVSSVFSNGQEDRPVEHLECDQVVLGFQLDVVNLDRCAAARVAPLALELSDQLALEALEDGRGDTGRRPHTRHEAFARVRFILGVNKPAGVRDASDGSHIEGWQIPCLESLRRVVAVPGRCLAIVRPEPLLVFPRLGRFRGFVRR